MSFRLFCCTLLVISSGVSAAQKKQIDYDAIYSKCISDEGQINDGIVAACSNDTSDAAKKEMIGLYKTIYDNLATDSPEDAKLFEQTQRAWLTYRNGQCNLAGAHVGSPMYSYCPMELNIARVKELRELAGE